MSRCPATALLIGQGVSYPALRQLIAARSIIRQFNAGILNAASAYGRAHGTMAELPATLSRSDEGIVTATCSEDIALAKGLQFSIDEPVGLTDDQTYQDFNGTFFIDEAVNKTTFRYSQYGGPVTYEATIHRGDPSPGLLQAISAAVLSSDSAPDVSVGFDYADIELPLPAAGKTYADCPVVEALVGNVVSVPGFDCSTRLHYTRQTLRHWSDLLYGTWMNAMRSSDLWPILKIALQCYQALARNRLTQEVDEAWYQMAEDYFDLEDAQGAGLWGPWLDYFTLSGQTLFTGLVPNLFVADDTMLPVPHPLVNTLLQTIQTSMDRVHAIRDFISGPLPYPSMQTPQERYNPRDSFLVYT